MLQAVSANEGRTSWRMKVALLLGGLAVLALPAVYLSRATIVRAEDPKQAAAADDEQQRDAKETQAKAKPVEDDAPFGDGAPQKPGNVVADDPFGGADDEEPSAKSASETPRAKPVVAGERLIVPPPHAVAVSSRLEVEPKVEFLPEQSQSEKLIVAALDRKVTLDFTEQPLIQVVSFLADVLEQKVPIQLDDRALEDAGVGADTPVTRSVKDVKLRTALKLLLGELDLTYLLQDEVLLITTQDKAETQLLTRTYPVGDLLEVVAVDRSAPKAQSAGSGMFQIEDKPAAFKQAALKSKNAGDPTEAPAAKAESGGAGAAAALAKTGTQKAKDTRKGNPDPYDVLIDVITTTVKPQSWDEVGGQGSISAVPVAQSLVISQTREVHDEVLELLRSLRAAKRAGTSD